MIQILPKKITGYRIRARKIDGGLWLIYELRDPDKQDFFKNRKPIDIINSKKYAIQYVENLDDDPGKDYKLWPR